MSLSEYIRSDRFLSFRVGYPAGAFLAVYWGIVAFVLRLIVGAHTLTQAGTEVGVFSAFVFAAYLFGYYVPAAFESSCRLVLRPDEEYIILSSSKRWFFAGLAAVSMVAAGLLVHSYIGAAFTSTFWLIVYALSVAWMMSVAVRDRQVQNWMDDGIA